MSLQNNLFCEDAEEDVKEFLKSDKRKRVLIFPPVNNYRRFLIHQLVQENYGELLQTFSIGQGIERRTVVCYKSDFIRLPQVNGVSLQAGNSDTEKSSCTMGIESQCTPTASPEHSTHKPRQVKSTPAVEIYRPPAVRKARLEKSPAGPQAVEPTSTDACARANRQKRPDRAVYVPRHRRSAPDVEVSNIPPPEVQSKPPKETLRTSWKQSSDKIATDQTVPKEMPVIVNDSAIEKLSQSMLKETSTITNNSLIEKMEDQVIIKTPETTTDFIPERMDEDNKTEAVSEEMIIANSDSEMKNEESDKRDRRKSVKTDDERNDNTVVQSTPLTSNKELHNASENSNKQTEPSESKSNEVRKERENKVIKQALVSRVLIISSKEDEVEKKNPVTPVTPVIPMTPPEKKVKKVERPKSKPAPPPLPPSKINRDECDWDSLFDDNGDCLDPTLIEELTSAVGEVVIEKPKSSYKTYTRPVEVSSDEFAHVLEIYNFPSDFKSSDLAAVFSPFKNGGFELKWVDDTHCLGVFSSPLVAAEVLASDHPFVKTRPLSEATPLSKTKVRRSSEFLQPYRTRPETCAALARRLVTKSLGVTLATARQEREQEKIVLREAKEKRRLANKQREDVWEGIIAEKPAS